MKFAPYNEQVIFDEFIQIRKAEIRSADKELSFERLRVKRDDAAVVLIHNVEKNRVVLVEQFRYAVHEHHADNLTEVPAGKVDDGETPEKAAVRETLEESGYVLSEDRIEKLGTFYVSPGYTSERFVLFYCPVKSEDKKDKGGGLDEENEYIKVVEVDAKTFYERIASGDICDAKTVLAAELSRKHFLQ